MKRSEKLIAVLLTFAMFVPIIVALNRTPLPIVHLDMNNECVRVVIEGRDGPIKQDCNTIDLKEDLYDIVYVMSDDEIKMATAR